MAEDSKTNTSLVRRAAMIVLAAAAFAFGVSAHGEISMNAETAKKGPAFKSSFRAPPPEAVKNLKAAVGKPFDSGWVFIDGKFVSPPYKVERWGNVIRINQIQATGEIVPWTEFIKTQDGVKVTKTEPESEPEPEPLDDMQEDDEDADFDEDIGDGDFSLDDLFDDVPEPTTKKPTKKPAKKSKPKPKKPVAKVTYSFDGEFVPNAKTASHLKKINDYRTSIDAKLRAGGYCFFGSKYKPFIGDSGAARVIIKKLADVMRGYSEHEAFAAALKAACGPVMTRKLVDDLFDGRIYYPAIQQRMNKKDDPLKKY